MLLQESPSEYSDEVLDLEGDEGRQQQEEQQGTEQQNELQDQELGGSEQRGGNREGASESVPVTGADKSGGVSTQPQGEGRLAQGVQMAAREELQQQVNAAVSGLGTQVAGLDWEVELRSRVSPKDQALIRVEGPMGVAVKAAGLSDMTD